MIFTSQPQNTKREERNLKVKIDEENIKISKKTPEKLKFVMKSVQTEKKLQYYINALQDWF
jgi:hypothetical protein